MVVRRCKPAKYTVLCPLQPPPNSHLATLGNHIFQCVVNIRKSRPNPGDRGRECRWTTLAVWTLVVCGDQIGQKLDLALVEAFLKQNCDGLFVIR